MGTPQEIQPTISLPLFNDQTGQRIELEVGIVEQEDGSRLVSAEALLVALKSAVSNERVIRFDCGLSIDDEQRRVTICDQPLPEELTKTEFSILWNIALRPRRVHSRDEILTYGWGAAEDIGEDVVNVNIKRLRKKLWASEGNRIGAGHRNGGHPGPNAGTIRTVSGFGYGMGDRVFSDEPLVIPTRTDLRAS